MKLIFRVAAGIVIGILLLQIATQKYYQYHAEKYKDIVEAAERNETERLKKILAEKAATEAIHNAKNGVREYYRKYRTLPKYASDVFCAHNVKCVDHRRDEWFYVKLKNGWARFKFGSNRLNVAGDECETTLRDVIGGCKYVPENEWPKNDRNNVNCTNLLSKSEKMICESEALGKSYAIMMDTYNKALAVSSDNDAVILRREQDDFAKELDACGAEKCFEIKIRGRAYKLGLGRGENAFFVDEDLERCVRSKLEGKLPFTWAVVSDVAHVQCEGKNISSIVGVEHMVGLKSLALSDNDIEDASQIGQLVNLTRLRLASNRISDLSFVENLGELKELDIGHNPLIDISSLSKMEKLANLRLDDMNDYNCRDLQRLASNEGLSISGKNDLGECGNKNKKTASRYAGINCDNGVTGAAVCGNSRIKSYDKEIVRLYNDMISTRSSKIYLLNSHEKWLDERNDCAALECLTDVYLTRLSTLYRYVHAFHSCKVDNLPLMLWNSNWVDAVVKGVPQNIIWRYGGDIQNAIFHSEIYGAAGTLLRVSWYKNDRLIKNEEIRPDDERYSFWSEIKLDDHYAGWKIKISTIDGCELLSQVLPQGKETKEIGRLKLSEGYVKADYMLAYKAILAHDISKSGILRETAAKYKEFLSVRDRLGDTPLLSAIRVGNATAVNILLDEGATPYVWDSKGISAIELANMLDDKVIANTLKQVMQSNPPGWIAPYTIMTEETTYAKSEREKKYFVFRDFDHPVKCTTRTIFANGHVVSHVWEMFDDKVGKWIPVYASSIPVQKDGELAISSKKLPEKTAKWQVHVYLDENKLQTVEFKMLKLDDPIKWSLHSPDVFPNKPENVMSSLVNAWAPNELLDEVMDKTSFGKEQLYYHVSTKGNFRALKYLMNRVDPLAKEKYPERYKEKASNRIPVSLRIVGDVIRSKRYEVLGYLLALGMSPDSKIENYSKTLLTVAAEANDAVATEMLLDYDAQVDLAETGYRTPLQTSARHCSYDTSALLLQHGAEAMKMNHEQETVYDIVKKNRCRPMAAWRELFMKSGNNMPVVE